MDEPIATYLPEEVLLQILEEAGQTVKPIFSLRHSPVDYVQLRTHTLVCKSWLQSARRALLKNLDVENTSRHTLLFSCLTRESPQLGNFVRSLDTHSSFHDHVHLKVMSRLLDVLPLLTSLGVMTNQFHHLHKHPVWKRIKRIRLRFTLEAGLPPSEHFPKGLESLVIVGESTLLDEDSTETLGNLKLNNLRALSFEKASGFKMTMQRRESQPVKRVYLPRAPNLTILSLEWPRRDEGDLLRRTLPYVLKEAASYLTHLELTDVQTTDDLLSELPLSCMIKLRKFVYNGRASWHDADTFQGLFPASLQHLTIQWSGLLDLAISLLTSLQDQAFLPNLQSWPVLIWLGQLTQHGITEDPSASVQREMLKLAIALTSELQRNRPAIEMPARYSAGDMLRAHLPVIPLPFGFVSTLKGQMRGIVIKVEEELFPLQAAGRRRTKRRGGNTMEDIAFLFR